MISDQLIGLVVVLLCAGFMVFYMLVDRKGSKVVFREIPAFKHLQQSIGLTVEEGKRLHVSLGSASILNPDNASAFVGLSSLERLAQFSMVSDRPPVVTSGAGVLALLSQDTLRYVYRYGNVLEEYNSLQARLAGTTPFAYALGSWPAMKTENVLSNVFIGNFGPEIGLLNEAVEKGGFSLAASDSLSAQAVLFATADEPLIGEELFAVPAYIRSDPFHSASLRTQDVLRWLVIAGLLLGAVIKILESILGHSIL